MNSLILSCGTSVDICDQKILRKIIDKCEVIGINEWAGADRDIFKIDKYVINHTHFMLTYPNVLNIKQYNNICKTISSDVSKIITESIKVEKICSIGKNSYCFSSEPIFLRSEKIEEINVIGTGLGTATRCGVDWALLSKSSYIFLIGFDLDMKGYSKYAYSSIIKKPCWNDNNMRKEHSHIWREIIEKNKNIFTLSSYGPPEGMEFIPSMNMEDALNIIS